MGAERCRRVQVRVAVDGSVAEKLCFLQSGNHSQHPLLLRDTETRLESNEIPHLGGAIFLSELHDRISFASSARVAEADRFQRSKAQSIAASLRHHLDG